MSKPELLPLTSISALSDLGRQATAGGYMASSIEKMRKTTDMQMTQPILVPGHGEAGSPAHNRHQANSRSIESAGLLFRITGVQAYAKFAADILLAYADKYLGLGFQVQKNTNPPGRIFHQMLNENMWLMYASLGYGYVRDTLTAAQQEHIKSQLLRPMAELSTVKYKADFDRITNHGLWAVSAVGICGLAIGDKEFVDVAVMGQNGDGTTRGYLAQISNLFAPSGFYIEGPYYHRFAIRPLCIFAEALHQHRPELDIYNYKNQVVGNTIRALLATAYPDGSFPAMNDSSRTMGITDEGVLISAALYFARYGKSDAIAAAARQQEGVWVQPVALDLANAVDAMGDGAAPYWPSIELNEGPNGDRGAQGFLRTHAQDGDITQVIMGYGQHGLSHGHFDALGITLFNRGAEVLNEYGYGRWVNIETKFGGRYLPENKSYCRQTIAHNAVVVDQKTQNGADIEKADSVHGISHFFCGSGDVQAMSAFANDHYPDVGMQRTVLTLNLPQFTTPVLIDLFRLKSTSSHQYDYALQYKGQICTTTLDCKQKNNWAQLGDSNGYQHLLRTADAVVNEPFRISWLQGERFNTWLSSASQGELILAQVGANDPSFNLRHETSMILRQQGDTHLFASAFETHGVFIESIERCYGSAGILQSISVIGHNDDASVVSLKGEGVDLIIMVSNRNDVTEQTQTEVTFNGQTFAWRGYFACKAAS